MDGRIIVKKSKKNRKKSMKNRHKDCRVVRRRGRVYVINKRNPRFKARQGWTNTFCGFWKPRFGAVFCFSDAANGLNPEGNRRWIAIMGKK